MSAVKGPAAHPYLYEEPRESDAERAAFKRGLREVNLWYVHQKVAVWLKKWVPDDGAHTQYDDRGWPVFENLVSQMVTDGPKLIDLNKVLEWLDVQFDERLKSLKFTNGRTDSDFVAGKYRQTFSEVFGSARDLWFVDLGWDDEKASRMARVIPSCTQLRMLSLNGNKIASRDAAVELLKAAASVPTLKRLYLQNNPIVRNSPDLQELWAASSWEPRAMLTALEGPPEPMSFAAGPPEEPGPSAGAWRLPRWMGGPGADLRPAPGGAASEVEMSAAGFESDWVRRPWRLPCWLGGRGTDLWPAQGGAASDIEMSAAGRAA